MTALLIEAPLWVQIPLFIFGVAVTANLLWWLFDEFVRK
jgi:hypothetical protein